MADEFKVPEGWKLVPIHPTNRMLEAAKHRFMCATQSLMGFNADQLAYKALLEAAPPPPAGVGRWAMADLPIELRGVAEELEQGSGFWRSCSGCHESNEGVPTGPFSAVFKCHLGGGCRECGGLGAVWDDTDYDDMADFMAQAEAGVNLPDGAKRDA
jgi:hypothetical protein